MMAAHKFKTDLMKFFGLFLAFLCGFPLHAADAVTAVSEKSFIFIRPEKSSHWQTSKGGAVSLPVLFPDGATKATLSVSGAGYSARYDNITSDEFELILPEAVSSATENVYDLELKFDDETVRTARIGVIQGLCSGAQGATQCRAGRSRSWGRVADRYAVVPVPYGTTSLTIDGRPEDAGLDGAQGWFVLDRLKIGKSSPVVLSAGDDVFETCLWGVPGFIMMFR
jgi:hypothetical protein